MRKKSTLTRAMLLLLTTFLIISVSADELITRVEDGKKVDIGYTEYDCLSYEKHANGTNICAVPTQQFIKTGERIESDGNLYIDGVIHTPKGYYCKAWGDEVHCVLKGDGVHKPDPTNTKCSEHGGMTCKIYKGYTDGMVIEKVSIGVKPLYSSVTIGEVSK